MQNIFTGVFLIGIGFAMGSSIFYGYFTLFNIFFDGLAVFFIGKGIFSLIGQKSGETHLD